MHEGTIGSQAWDSKAVNNWPTSSLATYLNGTYYNSINSTYRNMIATNTYYLGGVSRQGSAVAPTKEQAYLEEKGTAKATCTVGSGGETSATCPRATRWTGKIGLPYMSDFGYSMSYCSESNLSLVKDCFQNTWFNTQNGFWLMDHLAAGTVISWHVVTGVGVFLGSGVATSTNYGVIPVLYLKPEVIVTSGNGSSGTPYQLSL